MSGKKCGNCGTTKEQDFTAGVKYKCKKCVSIYAKNARMKKKKQMGIVVGTPVTPMSAAPVVIARPTMSNPQYHIKMGSMPIGTYKIELDCACITITRN